LIITNHEVGGYALALSEWPLRQGENFKRYSSANCGPHEWSHMAGGRYLVIVMVYCFIWLS